MLEEEEREGVWVMIFYDFVVMFGFEGLEIFLNVFL